MATKTATSKAKPKAKANTVAAKLKSIEAKAKSIVKKAKAKAKAKLANSHDPSGKAAPFLITRQQRRIMGELVTFVYVQFKDQPLIDMMRELTGGDEYYQAAPMVLASQIFHLLPNLEEREPGNPAVGRLIKWLNAEFAATKIQLANLLKEEVISFDLLWAVIKKGDEVFTYDEGQKVGGKVLSIGYEHSWSGRHFSIKVQRMASNGRKFKVVEDTFAIREFNGARPIAALPVAPIDAATKVMLVARGQKFVDMATKATHLEYNTHMVWQAWFGPQFYRAIGRCMIDQVSFGRINPSYDDGGYKRSRSSEGEDKEMDAVPADMLFACPGWIKGFSFVSKRWGEFSIEGLSPAVYNDKAFDQLVLKPKTKKMVRALVENSSGTFQDIIYGKGGGIIFLLHGDPGVGKTLTAESVAEIQHRPLYSVSIGELGTDPIKLEESLRQILEMATIWNAIILIDEADIFLEARNDDSEIERNAMVGVFLRLLEYHQGILFLTTNRVRSFDKAFHSRISLAIKYPTLTKAMRREIWANLLGVAGVTGMDIDSLSEHNVNGRQIKTAIRLAQALAKSESGIVTQELLELPIHHAEEFLKSMGGDHTSGGDEPKTKRARRGNAFPAPRLVNAESESERLGREMDPMAAGS